MTSWSRVVAAAGSSPAGRDALAQLCESYWYPVYAFVRRRERDPEKALDLTQGFFTRLIEKKHELSMADPERGRFRSYLLACLKSYLANEWDKETARSCSSS